MMKRTKTMRRWAGRLLMLAALGFAGAAQAEDKSLVDFTAANVMEKVKTNGVEAKTFMNGQQNVLEVTCKPSDNGYPGVEFPADGGEWDLSAFSRVEAVITNLGDKPLGVTVRVDNPGDWKTNPWNGENTTIPAGKTATATVTFGYSWGKPAFKLDPAKVTKVMVFTGKPKQEIKYRIETVRAAGKPGDKPKGVTTKVEPKDGLVLTAQDKIDPARISPDAGSEAAMVAGEGLKIKFSTDAARKYPGATLKAADGEIWHLGKYSQVDFTVKNTGSEPLRVFCRLDNNNANGNIHCATGIDTVPAGAEKVITVPFVTDKVRDCNVKDSGFVFGSDAVKAITIFTEQKGKASELLVSKIQGKLVPEKTPEWLGKRPPVEGSWKVTFEDDFASGKLDRAKWSLPQDDPENPYTGDPANMNCDRDHKSTWDKKSINTAKNALVEDGNMILRVTKGKLEGLDYANDKYKGRDYLSTVIGTFDRFAQKYGYFEARMKLPAGYGMWPAFWLMPDRGKEAGIWWKRNSTNNGGMEFDILEYLGRYGPTRYNIALHWDGYEKNHKATGTEDIYFAPDKDGYVTSGLLWEPGKASFYVQGRLVAVYENERVANVPGYILFTQPLGGWGTDGTVEEAKLPFDFKVDYVRVWQRDDLAGK